MADLGLKKSTWPAGYPSNCSYVLELGKIPKYLYQLMKKWKISTVIAIQKNVEAYFSTHPTGYLYQRLNFHLSIFETLAWEPL